MQRVIERQILVQPRLLRRRRSRRRRLRCRPFLCLAIARGCALPLSLLAFTGLGLLRTGACTAHTLAAAVRGSGSGLVPDGLPRGDARSVGGGGGQLRVGGVAGNGEGHDGVLGGAGQRSQHFCAGVH